MSAEERTVLCLVPHVDSESAVKRDVVKFDEYRFRKGIFLSGKNGERKRGL